MLTRMARAEFTLRQSPEAIQLAITTQQLAGYFRQTAAAGGRSAERVQWHRTDALGLRGRMPYMKSKNLCIYDFVLRMQPQGPGLTHVTLHTEHSGYSKIVEPAVLLFGCCICIGVPFIALGTYLGGQRLKAAVVGMQSALLAWDGQPWQTAPPAPR